MADVRIAVEMVKEGRIDKETAVSRVPAAKVEQLLFPMIDTDADAKVIGAWLFDEGEGDTTEDSSVNGIDGVLIGGPEWVEVLC